LCLVLVAGPGELIALQNEPFQPPLQRYYKALEDICRTGVTPDIDEALRGRAAGGGRGRLRRWA